MFAPQKQVPAAHVAGDPGHTADHQLLSEAIRELQVGVPTLAFVAPVTKSASYTLALSDSGGAVEMTSSSVCTVTVPTNAAAAFPVGSVVEVMQAGAGQVTIAPAGSTVSVVSSSTLTTRAQFSVVTLRKRSTNGWVLTGDRTASSTTTGTGTTTPPATVTTPRLTKSSTGQLQVNGAPFRFAWANIYWLGLNDNATGGTGSFVSDADIRLALDQAVAMGATGIRCHTLGISLGKTNTMMPTLGSWNDAALERADFVANECKKRGLYLWLPTTDRWDFYHGGGSTLAKLVLGSGGTISDFFNNSTVRTQHKAYLTYIMNRTNRYNSLRWGADPTVAVWETGNEIYDATQAWHTDIAAHLKSLAPLALIADGTAASGMHVAGAPGLNDANTDIVGGHFYDDHSKDIQWMTTDAAAAKAANKAYVTGEYDWTDTDNNTSKTHPATTRAQWHAAMEGNPNVAGSIWWSMVVDKNVVGTHRDGYELYADAPENGEQTAGRVALSQHAANMTANPTPTPAPAPVVVYGADSDTFTGSNGAALSTTNWDTNVSPGASATIQNNAAKLTTGTIGGYGDKVALVSKHAPRTDGGVVLTVFPADITKESYFQVALRAQTADTSIGDTNAYRLELNNSGVVTVGYRKASVTTAIGSAVTIGGWASGVPVRLEFKVVGSTVTLYAYTGSTRPSTPTITGTNTSLSAAGQNGIVLNGGSAADAVTWTVNDWAVS